MSYQQQSKTSTLKKLITEGQDSSQQQQSKTSALKKLITEGKDSSHQQQNKTSALKKVSNRRTRLVTSAGRDIVEVRVSLINYKNELTDQLNELTKLEKKVADQLKHYKGLERGNIRVSKSNGASQYHFKKQGDEKEHYIPKYEISKIQLLLQRDYDEKIHKVILDLIKRLTKFNKTYDVDCIRDFYNNLPEGRRKLVEPLLPTDQMIIAKWIKDHPGNKNTYEKKYEFQTLNGEVVRSKSEKMIADYLYTKGIPYICEPEIVLKDGRTVYPDFAALNIRESRTIYWEHLGLIDSENYASKNFNKLMDYEEIGLVLGDTLIVTMETQERPINMQMVDDKVRCFLE